MFRFTPKRGLEGDPRAPYTRAIVNLTWVGDVVHILSPAEIFDAFCEAIAEPLELVVTVVIDFRNGLPRSMSWKADGADWNVLESAELLAWSNFAELLVPEMVSSLPPALVDSGPDGPTWTMQPLGVPLLGIVQCGTRRYLGGADYALLKCMSAKLSAVLGRPTENATGRSEDGKV
jgi:hypothetical protein